MNMSSNLHTLYLYQNTLWYKLRIYVLILCFEKQLATEQIHILEYHSHLSNSHPWIHDTYFPLAVIWETNEGKGGEPSLFAVKISSVGNSPKNSRFLVSIRTRRKKLDYFLWIRWEWFWSGSWPIRSRRPLVGSSQTKKIGGWIDRLCLLRRWWGW